MTEFYTIYYLVLLVIYMLLPVLFRFSSLLAKKTDDSLEGRILHHKNELRGHAIVSIILSGVVLSFIPFAITGMEDSKGVDIWLNGIFVLACVGFAGFFVWGGVQGIETNRRSLRKAQVELGNARDEK
ncbi:hypothetical protein OG948_34175 (plasmid) [Embleya sp. NBC_00888]|uniref:hypothetical protein n=1 Tax=Embleya sp. NBC_00888 TaxID=2975960 RepID=UPI002F9075EB|nr:hypothetical protein OG948_34175 [Embleya sp. NBC_00888]